MIIDIDELKDCCPVDCHLTVYVMAGKTQSLYVNWAFEVNGAPYEYNLVGVDTGKICGAAQLEIIGIINEAATL